MLEQMTTLAAGGIAAGMAGFFVVDAMAWLWSFVFDIGRSFFG